MEALERAQTRLDNIRSVLPLLEALRTISLGRWQAAKKRKIAAAQYRGRLLTVAGWLQPHLAPVQFAGRPAVPAAGRVVVVLVGSERGLCGRFNRTIAQQIEPLRGALLAAGKTVELVALGTRLARLLQYQQTALAATYAVPPSASALARLSFDLSQSWCRRLLTGTLASVKVVHNLYEGPGRYRPRVTHLLPFRFLSVPDSSEASPWPPPIIETNPLSMARQIREQLVAVTFYELLLDSAAAEQSMRYQLMESATQNARRLTDELLIAVQTARRQAITQELQTLAAGAGLLGSTQT